MSKSDPFADETAEELLEYLTREHGEGIAEVARRAIAGEFEMPLDSVTRQVPFVVGHQPVVWPAIPELEQSRKIWLRQQAERQPDEDE